MSTKFLFKNGTVEPVDLVEVFRNGVKQYYCAEHVIFNEELTIVPGKDFADDADLVLLTTHQLENRRRSARDFGLTFRCCECERVW